MVRCIECKKKTHVNIKCRCLNKYCLKCLSEHKCTFDYYKENKIDLEKKLMIKISDKMNEKL